MRAVPVTENEGVFSELERGGNAACIDRDMRAVDPGSEPAAAVPNNEVAELEIDLTMVTGDVLRLVLLDDEVVAGEGRVAAAGEATTEAEGKFGDRRIDREVLHVRRVVMREESDTERGLFLCGRWRGGRRRGLGVCVEQKIGFSNPLKKGGKVDVKAVAALDDLGFEFCLVDGFNRSIFQGRCGGGARPIHNHAHFAEDFSGPESPDGLLPVRGVDCDFNESVDDEVGFLGFFTFLENNLLLSVVFSDHPLEVNERTCQVKDRMKRKQGEPEREPASVWLPIRLCCASNGSMFFADGSGESTYPLCRFLMVVRNPRIGNHGAVDAALGKV